MPIINRHKFLMADAGTAGLAGLFIGGKWLSENRSSLYRDSVVNKVKLENSGLMVSRIAMGTGTAGFMTMYQTRPCWE